MTLRALLLLPMLACGLAACQTDQTRLTATGREPLVCVVWLPISYASRRDTPETVGEIRKNNAKRAAYCMSPTGR
jgi:hypothetical protein